MFRRFVTAAGFLFLAVELISTVPSSAQVIEPTPVEPEVSQTVEEQSPEPAAQEVVEPAAEEDKDTVAELPGRQLEPGFVDPLVSEGASTSADVELDADGNPVDGAELAEDGDAETYTGQPQYQPPQVLVERVNEARGVFDAASLEYVEAIEIVRSIRSDLKVRDVQIDRLGQRSAGLIELSEGIRVSAETRAVVDFMLYQQGDTSSPLGSEATVSEQMDKYSMDSLLTIDSSEIDVYKNIRSEIDIEVRILEAQKAELVNQLELAEKVSFEYKVKRDQAQIEFEAFSAGSEVFVSGVVFPISGANVNLPLIDSFGFPRMPGTPDAHWHEGIDIFAPKGTPLVATESGVISRVGSGRLGGLKFWLEGDSGVDWYYAHLEAFAPDLVDGQTVEAGDLLGYVGDSGNAVGTPPHLHMEMHPGGGRPINPYPLLAMVVRTEQQNEINAFATEPIYSPLGLR